jgi:protein-S-isoprenylcysteine O-methyltransferase Ste14
VLSGVAIFSRGNLSPGVREDRANRWVIGAFGLIGLLDAHLPAYTDRKGFWTLDGDAIRWLGIDLFAAGSALRIWPVLVLGRRFSGLVAIQPAHTLVTSCVQGAIRHPVIWDYCQLAGLGARLSFGGPACFWQRFLYRRLSRAYERKRGCCALISAAGTRCIGATSRLIPGMY